MQFMTIPDKLRTLKLIGRECEREGKRKLYIATERASKQRAGAEAGKLSLIIIHSLGSQKESAETCLFCL